MAFWHVRSGGHFWLRIFHVACDRVQQKGPLGGRPFCCDRLGDDRRLLLWRSKNEKVGLGFVGMSGWLISILLILQTRCDEIVTLKCSLCYSYKVKIWLLIKANVVTWSDWPCHLRLGGAESSNPNHRYTFALKWRFSFCHRYWILVL